MHLKACFPKFAELIGEYQTPTFYKKNFQVDEDGRRESDDPTSPEQGADTPEKEADTDDEDIIMSLKNDDNDEASTYNSRAPLKAFIKNLALNKYERTFAMMAKTASNGTGLLDLTCDEAAPLRNQIHTITQLYSADFPAAAPKTASPVQVHVEATSGQSVQVQVAPADLDEMTYKDKLDAYNQKVIEHENTQLNNFVTAHIHTVLHDTNTDTDTDLVLLIHSIIIVL